MATVDHSPRCTLPVDTYVRATQSWREEPSYVARIVGYDMGRTKYQLGRRFPGWGEWLFLDGGSWAFPGEVEEITEEEANR